MGLWSKLLHGILVEAMVQPLVQPLIMVECYGATADHGRTSAEYLRIVSSLFVPSLGSPLPGELSWPR